MACAVEGDCAGGGGWEVKQKGPLAGPSVLLFAGALAPRSSVLVSLAVRRAERRAGSGAAEEDDHGFDGVGGFGHREGGQGQGGEKEKLAHALSLSAGSG